MSEPLPCPFCDCDVMGITCDLGDSFRFVCGNRDCLVRPEVVGLDRNDATQAWNTRAVTDRERKMVEAMKAAYGAPMIGTDIIDAIRLVEPDWSPT